MALYVNGQLEAGINQVPSYTQAEYDALEIKPEFWICTDRNYSSVPAANITYDNTDSGLSATNVQDAIDELEDDKSNKSDLTSIFQTGTTASQTIGNGTYFYLDNVLVRAKADIANGGTFTVNTNYEVVTAGALNELFNYSKSVNTKLDNKAFTNRVQGTNVNISTCLNGQYLTFGYNSTYNNITVYNGSTYVGSLALSG
jgi:hypothetical protein